MQVQDNNQHLLQKYLTLYLDADCVFLVYDVTSPSSFDDINSYWLNEVHSYAEADAMLILIGSRVMTQGTSVILIDQYLGRLQNSMRRRRGWCSMRCRRRLIRTLMSVSRRSRRCCW